MARELIAGREGARLKRQVASYLQRLCAKNETMSFFGPINYGRVEPDASTGVTVRWSGPELLVGRNTFAASWLVLGQVRAIAMEPEVAPWLVLRRKSFAAMPASKGAAPKPASMEELLPRLVEAVDGTRPLSELPILGAFLTEQGFMVDTEAYLNALLHDLHRRGVRVRLGEGARGVAEVEGGVEVRTEHETLRAVRLVVCAGRGPEGVAGLPPLPVKPMRGQMLTIFHPEVRLTRVVSGPTDLAPWRMGEIVVDATEEDAGFACHVTPTGLMELGATVAKLAPRLREARFGRAWAGLGSVTLGGKPLIGRYPGTMSVLIIRGHTGQGILTSALTGRAVAEFFEHGHSDIAAAFEPERVLATNLERS